jgi:riboflavin biosynthesis pyrimidine reductase
VAARGAGGVEFTVLTDTARAGALPPLTGAEHSYGGPLRFPDAPRPYVFANFVTSIDGVATLGLTDGTDSSAISGRSAADRFLMALLRAAADVVLIGAGTIRTTPRHQWIPAVLSPECGDLLMEFRAASGRTDVAPLAIVTASGDLPDHVALREPAAPVLVVTTQRGAEKAAAAAPRARVVVAAESGEIPGSAILGALEREAGAACVLCEGGPSLMGSLLRARAVHELFLTMSPRIAGRTEPGERRGIVDGWSAGPESLLSAVLLSVRRSGDHLFMRYQLVD